MQTLQRNATALVVAGRRVLQPFHARTLRVSLPSRAEPIPDHPHPPAPSLAANQSNVNSPESHLPKQPKKRSKTPPPSPKPKGKKPILTRKKSQPAQTVAKDSKRQKGVRKTKGMSGARQKNILDGSGFTPDDWGKDGGCAWLDPPECDLFHCAELAPPSPMRRRTSSKLRPRKEIVPATSNPSSSGRALPPHRIPYVRRTEGYISDDAEQCNNVLRGAS